MVAEITKVPRDCFICSILVYTNCALAGEEITPATPVKQCELRLAIKTYKAYSAILVAGITAVHKDRKTHIYILVVLTVHWQGELHCLHSHADTPELPTHLCRCVGTTMHLG